MHELLNVPIEDLFIVGRWAGGGGLFVWLLFKLLKRGDQLQRDNIDDLRESRDHAIEERDRAIEEVDRLREECVRLRRDLREALRHVDHDRKDPP